MIIGANFRLLETQGHPWEVVAMPQLVPEYVSQFFEEDEFEKLDKVKLLFEYAKHEVWAYKDREARYFVALAPDGDPLFISQATPVTLKFACGDMDAYTVNKLRGLNVWVQTSVAYKDEKVRTVLKGLATKIVWDYLVSHGNALVTDSQQTSNAQSFWKRILSSGKYLAFSIADDYTANHMTVVKCGRFVDGNHLQHDLNEYWTEADQGRLLRVLITR